DIKWSKNLRRLVAENNIVYTPDSTVISDETADGVFNAAVQLLATCGIYHNDTFRVIALTEDEIRATADHYNSNPHISKFGQGDDRIEFGYRKQFDTKMPILAAGPCGVIGEDWFDPYVRSFVKEKTNLAMGITGGIEVIHGHSAKAGTLSEMYAAQWECSEIQRICREEGRPGMHQGLLCTASSAAATFACIDDHDENRRKTWNTQIGIHIIPEMKIDWNAFQMAKFCQDRGIEPWTSCVSLTGALCRNGADTAVGIVCNALAQLAYGHGGMVQMFANHLDGTWSDQETQWAVGAATRAFERHVKNPIASVSAGIEPYWRTYAGMWQAQAMAISNTVNGMAYTWIGGHSGLEARLVGEVMEATTKIQDPAEADVLMNKVFAKRTEETAKHKESGKGPRQFVDAYNCETCEPNQELVDDYNRVKDELKAMGLPL
ncbi:MAG: monomethylamine:corrinoid methyltransferase, partial [Pseudomonadales bacterium]|nr:monomethylamine:corrinoid methyltransferase [Pseudomonadales bacterium]